MAQFGPLIDVTPSFDTGDLELIEPYAFGDLITPFVGVVPDGASSPIGNRFPVPPTAGGFLTDVEMEFAFDGVGLPWVVTGALYPESPYLEPRVGQIWPR